MTSFLMLLLGLALVFFEFYLPGGIMGISGGILILASIITFAMSSDSPLAIVGFVLLACASLGVLVKWTLWRIRHSNPERSIYSNKDQEGFQASAYDKEAIGKTGVVTSDLKPGGHIRIGKNIHSAASLSGYLEKGDEVTVVSGEGETLYVQPKKREEL